MTTAKFTYNYFLQLFILSQIIIQVTSVACILRAWIVYQSMMVIPPTVAVGCAKAAFFQQILASVLREKTSIKPPNLSDVFQHLVIDVCRPHFAKKEKIVVRREMLII